MKLTQTILPQYFSIADSTSSWYIEPTNTFDFIDRQSDTLVVTVGDSWTWGSDLSINNCDNEYRKNCVYGNLIATKLHADWLNLGLCAQGNFWIASMIAELAQTIPKLQYQHIYVICTLTGTLRWFNTKYDQHIDYIDWFKHNAPDFDRLPAWLNGLCLNSIIDSLASFDHVTLKIGTNFVDACGFDDLTTSYLMPDPWYKVLGYHDSMTVHTCVYYSTVEQALEFIEPRYHSEFKQWLMQVFDQSERRVSLLTNSKDFRNYHPLAQGHQAWAQYILKHLV
jgi:hypothetical protein